LHELSKALKSLCIYNTDPPTPEPTGEPSVPPTTSPVPSHPPTDVPSATPTDLPSWTPTGETFTLPDCYDGPKMIQKKSSDKDHCVYDSDMVQINEMNGTDVTVQINNIWTMNVMPSQTQVFIHTNGVDAVRPRGDGFQCEDDDGTDVDIEGDNEIQNIQCYQEDPGNPDSPFLAVIDVVITDPFITGSHTVTHPCMPDVPIMESCSWRFALPCVAEDMCTDEPTPSPSAYPTDLPSAPPTGLPSVSPTMSPTSSAPTTYPPTPFPSAHPIAENATPPPTEKECVEYERNPCPADIVQLHEVGVTPLPSTYFRIVSQDTDTVTVQFKNMYDLEIPHMFYKYKQDYFGDKCYEEAPVPVCETIDITMKCTVNSKIALMELYFADPLETGFLSPTGDDAEIPECCYPDDANDGPVTKYQFEFMCVSSCPVTE